MEDHPHRLERSVQCSDQAFGGFSSFRDSFYLRPLGLKRDAETLLLGQRHSHIPQVDFEGILEDTSFASDLAWLL